MTLSGIIFNHNYSTIPNNYFHFGDFDFAGIGIYINEFKKDLDSKTTFFIREKIDRLMKKFGNKDHYDKQKTNFDVTSISEENLLKLIYTFHKYKKGLDQEILMIE